MLTNKKGVALPSKVIERARDPRSPLHGEFQWDLKKAAYRDWMDTARALIREYVVEVQLKTTVSKIECPRYVHHPQMAHNQEAYLLSNWVPKLIGGPKALYRAELARVVSLLNRMEALSVESKFEIHYARIEKHVRALRADLESL